MSPNFMLADIVAMSQALLLWLWILFIPGYVFAWLIDALGFRRRGLLARCTISIPLAVAVVPVVTDHLWRWSLPAVWILYAGCFTGFVTLLFHERQLLVMPALSRARRLLLGIVAAWFLLSTLLLVDLQIGDRLYFPVAAYDYTLRTAITASITNTGIPPQNPYFFPGKPFVLHYHYFWYMLCSLVDRLGGITVTARHAMLAGTVWCGAGLIALVLLFVRFFRQAEVRRDLDRRMLTGIALLAVTGLDIIPIALVALLGRHLSASLESWNAVVPSWIHAVLWVPHYIAALIACMAGFLVLQHGAAGKDSWRRVLAGIAGGLAFASAAGLGIYIAVVFGVFLMIWLAVCLMKRIWDEAGLLCLAGMVALAAAAPYLASLMGGGSGAGANVPFGLAVRPFFLAQAIVETSWAQPGWREPLVNALVLPLNYFLELGFFFVVGVMQWRKMRRGKAAFTRMDWCGFSMAATSLVIVSFFRSSVISANDLGYRGILVAQFILLIWAVDLWEELFVVAVPERTKERRKILLSLIVLGVCGSLYEVCMFRFFPIISDRFPIARYEWLSRDHNLGQRTNALRALYDRLRSDLPVSAMVQHNPNAIPGDLFYGLYADRQAVAETSGCGVVLGGDPALCTSVIGPLNDLFEKPGEIQATGVDAICHDLGIDALVVKDTDKVWADKGSWVWTKRPDMVNDYARVFLCGRGKETSRP